MFRFTHILEVDEAVLVSILKIRQGLHNKLQIGRKKGERGGLGTFAHTTYSAAVDRIHQEEQKRASDVRIICFLFVFTDKLPFYTFPYSEDDKQASSSQRNTCESIYSTPLSQVVVYRNLFTRT